MGNFFEKESYQDVGSEDRYTRTIAAGTPNSHFPNNKITNTKYTIWTFLPMNLYEQFGRFMNQYFLLVAILQLWPTIAAVSPVVTWVPLIIIFSFSAFREAVDDIRRWRADKQANERNYWVVRNGTKTAIQAQDIHVGDILFLQENDEIPCDALLLASSDVNGFCYIQTTNVDGESDLKPRQAVPETALLTPPQLNAFRGTIECASPNAEIYKWDSRLRLASAADSDWISLSAKQMLLQATHLRNTEFVFAIVVYTGNETKVGNNKRIPTTKWTWADTFINKLSAAVFVAQICLIIFLGATGNFMQLRDKKKLWYIRQPRLEFIDWLILPLRFMLLMTLMIPISLKVTLDIIRIAYAWFIEWDYQLRDPVTDTPAEATSTALAEDLGQIQYIFSDKTGTLTENKMVFLKCAVNNRVYGNTSEHPTALGDPSLAAAIRAGDGGVVQFFRTLALCHSVVPSLNSQNQPVYKASSPDEKALVEAATTMRVKLMRRTPMLELEMPNAASEFWEPLYSLDFTPERKRMSVLLRHRDSHEVVLFTKGADDRIVPLLAPGQGIEPTLQAMESFARLGLRTLCVASRRISAEEFANWRSALEQANTQMQNREAQVNAVYERIEQNMVLHGVTAIEDKLQEEVPETISVLRRAGIKIWMLTGDKYSTAVQIATACNLMPTDVEGKLLTVSGVSAEDIRNSVNTNIGIARELKGANKICSVIVEGNVLRPVLIHYATEFLELCMAAHTVICCRVTPHQKAQVVQLVKHKQYRTLAIGDGGNDVSMIQEAHVGVGIIGQEGMQAARAADYTFAKFKFLKRLLLVHGRYAYRRTAFIAQYSFYKSTFLAFIQLLYAFYSHFSGQTFFDGYSMLAWNIFYTSIPTGWFMLDKDIPENAIFAFPELYRETQGSYHLNVFSFAAWMGRAVLQAIAVLVLVVNIFGAHSIDKDGKGNSFALMSTATYAAAITIHTITIFLETHYFVWVNLLSIWGCFVLYFFVTWLYSVGAPGQYEFSDVAVRLYTDLYFWLAIAILVVVTVLPVFLVKYINTTYFPTRSQIARVLTHQARTHGRQLEPASTDPSASTVLMAMAPFEGTAGKEGSMRAPLLGQDDYTF